MRPSKNARLLVVAATTCGLLSHCGPDSRRLTGVLPHRIIRAETPPSASLAVVGDDIAPSAYIVEPRPNLFVTPLISTAPTIRWRGEDPDGRIVYYKYRLFGPADWRSGEPNWFSLFANDPDSLLRYYAPGFARWDSVGPTTTSVKYTNLVPNQFYVFAVVAFDDAGTYSRVFGQLTFWAVEASLVAPIIQASSSFFNFTTPPREVTTGIPAGIPVEVRWSGLTAPGLGIAAYRWVLDPVDPADERSRSHETADPNHWSVWSPSLRSAIVGPFRSERASREGHSLYIQARDTQGIIGQLIIRFTILGTPEFSRDLLVVDDTRLIDDQARSGVLDGPRGPWPSAAELDTFLFARGGYPWKGYPLGTLSPQGLLAGYDFDTLGTRALQTGVVPLDVLNRYRHVLWMTDAIGASYSSYPNDLLQPETYLRAMSLPGAYSTLAAYVTEGGHLWLCGGGAAYVTLASWGRRGSTGDEFTNADGELVSGRFMYDLAHWQSAVTIGTANLLVVNETPGRGWAGQGLERNLDQPDYAKLVSTLPFLSSRTCSTDPPSPLRDCGSFYIENRLPVEFLGTPEGGAPNIIREDADPRPHQERLESTLDTLYFTSGGTATPGRPIMTYYHGFQSGSVVFSGFPIWHFQRQQCMKLTDFVLQDIWGQRPRWTRTF